MNDNGSTTLNVLTRLDVSPDRILSCALGQMREVVIVGFDKDGQEYFASSVADGGSTLWHLARAQHRLLCMPDD